MNTFLPKNAVTVYRGTSKTYELAITDDTGEAVDITDAILYFTVKRDVRDTTPLFQKTSTDVAQIEIDAPRSGHARIYLAPSDTQYLDAAQYTFDVLLVMPTGERYLIVPPTNLVVLAAVTVVP